MSDYNQSRFYRDILRRRFHVATPQMWGESAGTDFWMVPSVNGMLTASKPPTLADYGWTTTDLALTAGAGGDFLSATDIGSVNRIAFDAASDMLLSPAIFGDYAHGKMAESFLGFMPTQLNVEVVAAFPVVANNETNTAFGLVEDGGSPITAADALAMIFSDGTNFGLRSGAATDAGALVDTAVHRWLTEVTATTVTWYIDGTSQGTLALEADEWPAAFGAGIKAAGSNTLSIGPVHIWYS